VTAYRHPDSFVLEAFEDGLVVYLDRPRTLHHLDPVAGRIWAALGSQTVEEVITATAETYPGDPAGVLTDLRALVGRLLDEGLLETVAAPSGETDR
jgi:hypothetical protein